MVQDSPSRRQDQFVLRLPDGMRDRLKGAAEENRRSMNAEIVARLAETLNSCELDQSSARASAKPPSEENTIYIVLDTDGMPISWNEALTHIGEINRRLGKTFDTQAAYIITPKVLSSRGREREDFQLIQNYAKLRRKQRHQEAPTDS